MEPRIEELLTDPIAELVMKRDGIDATDIWDTVSDALRACRVSEVAPMPSPDALSPLVLAK